MTTPTTLWTLQEFSSSPTGRPYFALVQQTDQGPQWGASGTRDEIDRLCRMRGITPQAHPAIEEYEYYRRFMNALPENLKVF